MGWELTIKKGEVFLVAKKSRCDMMVMKIPSKKLEVKQQEMWI